MEPETAAGPATREDTGFRRARPWIVGALVIVVIAVVVGPGPDNSPLSPDSPRPAGTKALVELLRAEGADVDITRGLPDASHDVALVLSSQFERGRLEELSAWSDRGGVIVVTDPSSFLAPSSPRLDPTAALTSRGEIREPECTGDFPAMAKVRSIDTTGGPSFRAPARGVGCFPDGKGAFFLVAAPQGEGTVVATGGAGPFINDHIDEEDNAMLAVSLLAPRPGSRVAFLQEPEVGQGDISLRDLVPGRVKQALWQLVVAFGLLALWRSRRLARPVVEPAPVEIAGSELVVAVGHLMQRSRNRDHAAAQLRAELQRVACERLGLPRDLPPEHLVAAIVERTGADRIRVEHALIPRPVVDEDALVSIARSVEAVRQEVLHAR